jgi:LacI family transcriptional regulator
MTTLKDIAQEAGVSVMTVSNVVNGNSSKVSPKTAERIQKIIKRLNYVPNFSARSLVNSNSHIISVIIRGEKDQNPLKNPHNAALVGTIIHKIQQQGYYAMINIMKSVSDISQSLRTWNAEGAIFLGMFDDEIEEMCTASDIPMVFIDSYSKVRQLSNVGIDDYKGGRLAAKHLIKHGHKTLAFIGPPSSHTGVIQQRYSGFYDELTECRLTLNPQYRFVLESDVDYEEIKRLGIQIAKYKGEITGAFITSDQIASFLINVLRQNGLCIPEDLSLIGFDNLEICCQLTPQLTTIAQDLRKKAELTVDILFRRLRAPDSPFESRILDVSLVERNSVQSRPCPIP